MMGLAFAIIWSNVDEKHTELKKKAMILFGIQLVLNALWSILFFGMCNPFLAFLEIILLWLLIFETIKAFGRIDRIASRLLYLYLAWVSFATILNGSIWYLNR
jgi:translocator protein